MTTDDFPTHDEIEAARGGGLLPDFMIDWMHDERDRYDATQERWARLASTSVDSETVTFPIVRRQDQP